MSSRATAAEAARILTAAGLAATPRRRLVLGRLLSSDHAMTPPELMESLGGDGGINKVTLYRILDLLVEHHILQRSSAGERAYRYCLRDAKGRGHGHFLCRRCGAVICLLPDSLPLDGERIEALPMLVEEVDVRLVGLCERCRSLED